MPQPTTLTSWATNDVQEVVNLGGSVFIVFNKAEPTESFLNSGVLARQPWPRPYVNYMLNSHGQWIEHLNQGEIGDIKWMPTTTTATEMETRFTGTWEDLGTTSFSMTPSGNESLRLFRKTA